MRSGDEMPFLNQGKVEIDRRKYFMINLHEILLPTQWGSNPQPPDLQSDVRPTEPPADFIALEQ